MNIKKYRFSFTAASLKVNEMVLLAEVLSSKNIEIEDLDPSVLNKQRLSTNKREFIELILRMKQLSEDEISALAFMSIENQRLICFISCIRTYLFLKEFVEEVILENVKLLKFSIDELDYTVFFNRKALEYSQIENLAESTKYKIKQVLFKMLEEAGLIDQISSRTILIPYLNLQIRSLLSKEDLKYLLN